jgi:hypothetical protein
MMELFMIIFKGIGSALVVVEAEKKKKDNVSKQKE